MFGVQGANAGVKKIAQAIGIKMTKQIFAEGVSKVVPVIGSAVTGGLSYITFKPCAKKLKNSFKDLYLCDPQYYKELRNQNIIDIDVEFFEESEKNEKRKE